MLFSYVFQLSWKFVPLLLQWEVLALMYIIMLMQINKRSCRWLFLHKPLICINAWAYCMHCTMLQKACKLHNWASEIHRFLGCTSWIKVAGWMWEMSDLQWETNAKQKCKEILERDEGKKKEENLVYFNIRDLVHTESQW